MCVLWWTDTCYQFLYNNPLSLRLGGWSYSPALDTGPKDCPSFSTSELHSCAVKASKLPQMMWWKVQLERLKKEPEEMDLFKNWQNSTVAHKVKDCCNSNVILNYSYCNIFPLFGKCCSWGKQKLTALCLSSRVFLLNGRSVIQWWFSSVSVGKRAIKKKEFFVAVLWSIYTCKSTCLPFLPATVSVTFIIVCTHVCPAFHQVWVSPMPPLAQSLPPCVQWSLVEPLMSSLNSQHRAKVVGPPAKTVQTQTPKPQWPASHSCSFMFHEIHL